MAISVTSRIRNAMVSIALSMSLLFAILIFLMVYVIEDQVFVNQIKVEQRAFEKIIVDANTQQIRDWQPANANIKRINLPSELPANLPSAVVERVTQNYGVHEYFDHGNAVFIAKLLKPNMDTAYYLIYDVKDLLVVRNTKHILFVLIGGLTSIVAIIAVILARRLTKATLTPVSRLSHALQNKDLDHVIIELAHEFSEDEFGILTHELALAVDQIKEAAQREYEFNRGVSHELRSPIQAAQSATELLQIYASENDTKIAGPISRLQRSVAEMSEVAEAFLWLAGDKDIKQSEMCSVLELKNTLIAVQAMCPAHKIVINIETQESFRYRLPTTVLSVVLRNLLRNAIVHGESSSIDVDIRPDRISVSNSINSVHQDNSGFRIGLSIVQRICDRFDCELIARIENNSRYSSSIVFI